MKTFSLYVDKNSFVHDIDSISKLFFIVLAFALPVILPDLRVLFVCALFSLSMLIAAGVLKNALPFYGFVTFVLFTVVLIQGIFGVNNQTPAFILAGITFYREGLLTSLKVILRVYTIVQSFLVLVLTTRPSDLVDDLVEKGLSPRLGYVIISTFQIIPQMMATVDTITDAQRSRGMETEGSLLVRCKAFIPLLGPVALSSFMSTKERAMALEVRAFSAQGRTALQERVPYKYGKILKAAMLVLLVSAIIWRFLA